MNTREEAVLELPIEQQVVKKKQLPRIVRNIRVIIRIINLISPRLAGRFAFHIYARPRKPKKKANEPILDTASIFYLPYKEGKLKVYSWGSSNKKVLLMHGWESKSTTFRELIPVFLEKGLSVVALDAPAHGGSSGTTTDFIDWGEAVVEVMEHFELSGLPIRNVVAHSFGGAATLNMLNRGRIELEKFVTISSPFFFHTYFSDFCKIFLVSKKAQSHMLHIMDNILDSPFMDFHLSDEVHLAPVGQMMIVHDKEDKVIAMDHPVQMKGKFDKPKYVFTQGLGHYHIIKDKEVIENIARFLIS